MCPSFSLWAWRILKIRSCLRKPLVPGSSKVRAILVSSVIFFSFNSEIVIQSPGWGIVSEGLRERISRISTTMPRCQAKAGVGRRGGGGVFPPPPRGFKRVFFFLFLIIRRFSRAVKTQNPLLHSLICVFGRPNLMLGLRGGWD